MTVVTEIVEVDGPTGEALAKQQAQVLLEIAQYLAAKNTTNRQFS